MTVGSRVQAQPNLIFLSHNQLGQVVHTQLHAWISSLSPLWHLVLAIFFKAIHQALMTSTSFTLPGAFNKIYFTLWAQSFWQWKFTKLCCGLTKLVAVELNNITNRPRPHKLHLHDCACTVLLLFVVDFCHFIQKRETFQLVLLWIATVNYGHQDCLTHRQFHSCISRMENLCSNSIPSRIWAVAMKPGIQQLTRQHSSSWCWCKQVKRNYIHQLSLIGTSQQWWTNW